MVVDDQTSMRAMIRRTLQDLGFKDIRDKAGPVDALGAIRSDRVHLIISDYNMPDMDGLQFLEEILILFLFILLLEASGYMTRAAFVMDRVMAAV
eukprot:gene66800-91479_t